MIIHFTIIYLSHNENTRIGNQISQMIELQKFDAIDVFDLDLRHKCRQFYH